MKLLPVIILLIFCLPTTIDAAASLTSVLKTFVKIGALAMEAIEAYERLANNFRAKGLIKVENFLNQPLTQCAVIKNDGLTKSGIPITIHSGYEEGFAVRQNEPGQGVDMVWSCRARQSSGVQVRIMVRFTMKQKIINRRPNTLGVVVVEDVDNDLLQQEHYLSLIRRSEDIRPLQCIFGDIAVQVTMSDTHQAEIDILVYPKLVEQIATTIPINQTQKLDFQRQLNNILDFKQSCLENATKADIISHYKENNGLDADAVYGIIGGVSAFVFLILLYCCISKCCCGSTKIGGG